MAASLDRRHDLEAEIVGRFASRRVDGLLLVPTATDQSYLATERRSGWPVVCVDRLPVGVEIDAVLSDNREASERAVRHLISFGHRRIGMLCDETTLMTARERLAGYREAMNQAGLDVDPSWIRVDVDSLDRSDAAVRDMMRTPDAPTAIFAAQNYVTMGACRALHHAGREHEIALVGFDDFPMADVLDPGVSVVVQDARRMGNIAAEALFDRMDGMTSEPMTHIVGSTLTPRGSGEIPPA
jgi:LacI family transcriptional regulator